jgi:hypothetical protein
MTTQAKHTPGPWSVTESFCNNACNRLVVKRKTWGGEVVADLGEAPDASRANARLIAAAPEMLEALRAMVSRAPFIDQSVTAEGLANCEALAKAGHAIRQAEGEQ